MSSVVVFDGLCNLCSHTVGFILEHEASPTLQFASVQSAAGSLIMRELGFDPNDAKTFVLVEDGQACFRSEAAIRVARHFRAPWRWLTLTRFIPRAMRDWIYDLVARNRYKWFGRRAVCMMPSAEIAARFLPDDRG